MDSQFLEIHYSELSKALHLLTQGEQYTQISLARYIKNREEKEFELYIQTLNECFADAKSALIEGCEELKSIQQNHNFDESPAK